MFWGGWFCGYGPGSCGRYASTLNTPRGTGVAAPEPAAASVVPESAAAGAAVLGGAAATLLPSTRERAERAAGSGVGPEAGNVMRYGGAGAAVPSGRPSNLT